MKRSFHGFAARVANQLAARLFKIHVYRVLVRQFNEARVRIQAAHKPMEQPTPRQILNKRLRAWRSMLAVWGGTTEKGRRVVGWLRCATLRNSP